MNARRLREALEAIAESDQVLSYGEGTAWIYDAEGSAIETVDSFVERLFDRDDESHDPSLRFSSDAWDHFAGVLDTMKGYSFEATLRGRTFTLRLVGMVVREKVSEYETWHVGYRIWDTSKVAEPTGPVIWTALEDFDELVLN